MKFPYPEPSVDVLRKPLYKEGGWGYIEPRSILIDYSDQGWMDRWCSVEDQPTPDHCVYVESREDGFWVDPDTIPIQYHFRHARDLFAFEEPIKFEVGIEERRNESLKPSKGPSVANVCVSKQ